MTRATRVATLGAAYSANKGAASMLEALVQGLPRHLGPVDVTSVSTHADDDVAPLRRAGLDISVASQTPFELALVHLPLAVTAALLRTLRLPWRWLMRPAALRAYAEAEVVVDISGISFVDGRRPAILLYNTLVDTVPLLLGRPVVKAAQAMGPFRTPLNRRAAGQILPRMASVAPRGAATAAHLDELGLTNTAPANDLAFCLEVDPRLRDRMLERLAEAATGPYLAVSPSQVVDTACRAQGIDYEGIMVAAVDALVERAGHHVVLIAHSALPEAGVTHMNDLPLCRAIHRRLAHPERVTFYDDDLLPAELRTVIGASDVLVTSRFHAMISSLAEQTPPLVVGWSHKYAEILDPFGLGDVALAYTDLTTGAAVADATFDLLGRANEVGAAIAAHLPAATAEAEANFPPIATAAGAPPR